MGKYKKFVSRIKEMNADELRIKRIPCGYCDGVSSIHIMTMDGYPHTSIRCGKCERYLSTYSPHYTEAIEQWYTELEEDD